MKRFAHRAVLFVLVAYALASVYAAASALWQPLGTIGVTADYGATVRSVVAGGAAARAGIRAGDRFDLGATPFDERRYIAGVGSAMPIGATIPVTYVRDRAVLSTRLTAERKTLSDADRFAIVVQCTASLIFIAVGALLILMRPGAATWGFGLYCLLEIPTSLDPFRFANGTTALAAVALYDVMQNVGVIGLLVFTLEFPRHSDDALHRIIRRALPFIFLTLAAMTLYPDVMNLIFARGARLENYALQIAFGAAFSLALVLLYRTYRRIEIGERERMRWILVGFGFGLVLNYFGATLLFSTLIDVSVPLWLSTLLVSLNVLLPLAIAHAVVRHRVLDVNFVISQTLVYAALTTILAALFSLLDWLFGSVLAEFRLSRLLEAAASMGVAFTFNALHRRTEDVVESIFFRERRSAEARLTRLTGELPHARSNDVVENILVGEVVDALGLTSAAVYLSRGDAFARGAAYGYGDADCRALDDSDVLVLSLRAQLQAVRPASLPWRRADLPAGARAPVLAIPLRLRGSLAGIVLYGPHSGGADIDPDETQQLESLARAAAVGIDEIDAERLRREFDLKSAAYDRLEARLDELRRTTRTAFDDSGPAVRL